MAAGSEDSRPDTRAPRRDPYRDVGERTRQSWERALAGGATPAELVVLGAVIYWTTTFSKLGDPVSLGRIAVAAGLWRGRAEDCPREVQKTVVKRVRRLESLGAIRYVPGGQGRGQASWVEFPPLSEGSILVGGGSIEDRLAGVTEPPQRSSERGGESTPKAGADHPHKRGQENPIRGGQVTPPHEEVSRTKSSRTVREARAGHDAGSLAALLAERTTTDGLGEKPERVARHVAELVLDRLPNLDPDVLERAATPGRVVDFEGDAVELEPMTSPIDYLARLEYVIGDQAAAPLTEDPRRDALVTIAYVVADAVALNRGTHWTDHVDEALDVEQWLDTVGAPDGIVGDVLIAAHRREFRRPAQAADLARRRAREIGLEWPELERDSPRSKSRR